MVELVNYKRWNEYSALDPKLREEMNKMSEKELFESFYTNMEFGTAGIRGILGPGTNKMNIYTVRKASEAFARYLLENVSNTLQRGIVIAHDNRNMSREFCIESAKVFATHGIKTFIFDSLRPTPELSYAVRDLKADLTETNTEMAYLHEITESTPIYGFHFEDGVLYKNQRPTLIATNGYLFIPYSGLNS